MSPMFIFVVGAVVIVLLGALVMDLRQRRLRGIEDASVDAHRTKQKPREGSEFRKGGPGGVSPSDPGFGGM